MCSNVVAYALEHIFVLIISGGSDRRGEADSFLRQPRKRPESERKDLRDLLETK